MEALGEVDAYLSKSFMFVGVSFDGILEGRGQIDPGSCWGIPLTAIGFANVRTKSDVIFNVRDMLCYNNQSSRTGKGGQWQEVTTPGETENHQKARMAVVESSGSKRMGSIKVVDASGTIPGWA